MNYAQDAGSGTSRIPHIGLLYSYGPHFRQALAHLRRTWPDATITALVPPDFPKDALCGMATHVIPGAPTPGSQKSLAAGLALLRAIRRQKFDVFVVLFNSPKLQMLGACSGAAERCIFGLDGTLRTAHTRPLATLAATVARRIRGHLLYARIWLYVRCVSVSSVHHHAGNGKNTGRRNDD